MEVTLPQLMKVIRKNLQIILICTLVVGIGTFGVSKVMIPQTYVSTVRLYVSTPTSSSANESANMTALTYAQKVVSTYIEMLQTNSFLEKVQKKSGAAPELNSFKKKVKFSILNDTEVFEASASARSPEEAKKIADTISELAPTTISEFKAGASLKIVDPASYPEDPSSPNVFLNTLVGFLLGLILSVCFFVLKERLDVRIKGEEDIAERYNIPVLASIPAFNKEFTKQRRDRGEDRKRR